MSIDYKKAGVDISRGEEVVHRIKKILGKRGSDIGHFGGAIPIPIEGNEKLLLVSSIDGVGTKISIAKAMNKYDTIGADLVHHSVNDLMCCGAEPIAFMDYVASSKLDVDVIEDVLKGIINSCDQLDIRLIGGETAEMPGVYIPGEIDLVGAIYGFVKEKDFIDGSKIKQDDVMLAFPSTGLHTNGYSLARKILEMNDIRVDDRIDGTDKKWGEGLLAVHRCYRDEICHLMKSGFLKGIAHITGGGIFSNTSRIIPKDLTPNFDWDSWEIPLIFKELIRYGNVDIEEARRVFNLGVGLVVIVDPNSVETLLEELDCFVIGNIDSK